MAKRTEVASVPERLRHRAVIDAQSPGQGFTEKNTLGIRIKDARSAKNWSQADLGRKAGVDSTAISRIERGATPDPGVFMIRDLAHALGMSTDELLGSPHDELVIKPVMTDETLDALLRRLTNAENKIDEEATKLKVFQARTLQVLVLLIEDLDDDEDHSEIQNLVASIQHIV